MQRQYKVLIFKTLPRDDLILYLCGFKSQVQPQFNWLYHLPQDVCWRAFLWGLILSITVITYSMAPKLNLTLRWSVRISNPPVLVEAPEERNWWVRGLGSDRFKTLGTVQSQTSSPASACLLSVFSMCFLFTTPSCPLGCLPLEKPHVKDKTIPMFLIQANQIHFLPGDLIC